MKEMSKDRFLVKATKLSDSIQIPDDLEENQEFMGNLWKRQDNEIKKKFKIEMAVDGGLTSNINSELKNSILEKVQEEIEDQTISRKSRGSVAADGLQAVTEMRQKAEFDNLLKQMVSIIG